MLAWLQEPETIDRLQDGLDYVASGALPTAILVLGGALTVSVAGNLFTLWQRIGMWREGAK